LGIFGHLSTHSIPNNDVIKAAIENFAAIQASGIQTLVCEIADLPLVI
jgi:hypothetical protein